MNHVCGLTLANRSPGMLYPNPSAPYPELLHGHLWFSPVCPELMLIVVGEINVI